MNRTARRKGLKRGASRVPSATSLAPQLKSSDCPSLNRNLMDSRATWSQHSEGSQHISALHGVSCRISAPRSHRNGERVAGLVPLWRGAGMCTAHHGDVWAWPRAEPKNGGAEIDSERRGSGPGVSCRGHWRPLVHPSQPMSCDVMRFENPFSYQIHLE